LRQLISLTFLKFLLYIYTGKYRQPNNVKNEFIWGVMRAQCSSIYSVGHLFSKELGTLKIGLDDKKSMVVEVGDNGLMQVLKNFLSLSLTARMNKLQSICSLFSA